MESLSMYYDSSISFLDNTVRSDILFYAIAFSAVVGKLKESSKKGFFSMWATYFMGTLFHELAHLFASFITFGKPTWFSLIPKKSVDSKTGKTSVTLGYVQSSNVHWWNTFFISMAPLVLLPIAFYVYQNFFSYFDETFWNVILFVFTIVSLLFSAIPSSVDFSNVFNRHLPANLIAPTLVVVGFYFYDLIIQGVAS